MPGRKKPGASCIGESEQAALEMTTKLHQEEQEDPSKRPICSQKERKN
jgi:hypothetical protein